MSYGNVILTLALPATLLGGVGCERSQNNAPIESPKTAEQTEPGTETAEQPSDFERERDEWKRDAEARLDQLDRKLEQWQLDLEASGEQIDAEAEEIIADLREARDAAAQKLDQLGHASRDQWEEVKRDAGEAMSAAESAYNDALEKLQTE